MTDTTSPTPAEHTAPPTPHEHYRVEVWTHGDQLIWMDTKGGYGGKPDLSPEDEASIHQSAVFLLSFLNQQTESEKYWREECKTMRAAVNERAGLLERVRKLEEALRGLSSMYTHAWDLADGGGLIMLPPSMERFEAAHEAARAALQPEQETAK